MTVGTGLWNAVLGLAVLSILITIFRALNDFFSHIAPSWSSRIRKSVVLSLLVVLILCSFLLLKGKFCASRPDYAGLREVAITAYHRNDYNSVIGIITWILQFQNDDDSYYRLRALAYKRIGDYRSEIEDRRRARELNPGREQNHLPMIEDYILLHEYDHAQGWIQEYEKSVKDSDVRTMFEFLELICEVLKGNEHSSRVAHLRTTISARPLSRDFVQKFWEWEPLSSFINASSISPDDKKMLQELADEMRRSAR